MSTIFCKLGTDIEDPRERITAMSVANANAKDHHKAVPADTLQEWAEFAAPRTFGLAVRMVSDLRLAERAPVIHNLVISNVPGPPVPLYFIGARIDALYPLGPVFHGAGLNITVMSNNGEMHIGAIACRELMPRVWDLVDQFPAELKAMKAAVLDAASARPAPARGRASAPSWRGSPRGGPARRRGAPGRTPRDRRRPRAPWRPGSARPARAGAPVEAPCRGW